MRFVIAAILTLTIWVPLALLWQILSVDWTITGLFVGSVVVNLGLFKAFSYFEERG